MIEIAGAIVFLGIGFLVGAIWAVRDALDSYDESGEPWDY
jgi:hypothetical protein